MRYHDNPSYQAEALKLREAGYNNVDTNRYARVASKGKLDWARIEGGPAGYHIVYD